MDDEPRAPDPGGDLPPLQSRWGVFRPRKDHPRDRRRTRPYAKHGLDRLKTAVRLLGARAVDRRTAVGKALAEWRGGLIEDLGGRDNISTQQAAIVELAVRNKLLLDSIDAWLLTQRSLVDHRRRALLPVVRERQALADALARYMTALGLERRAKKIPDLQEYLAQKYRAAPDSERGSPPDNNGVPPPSADPPRADTPTTAPTTSRPT